MRVQKDGGINGQALAKGMIRKNGKVVKAGKIQGVSKEWT